MQEAIENSADADNLFAKGVDVNVTGGKMYGSALAAAAAKGDEEMFYKLLSRGANVSLQASAQSCWRNALQAAVQSKHDDFGHELLERRADFNAPGRYGSPLIAPSGFGGSTEQVRLVKKLSYLGADLEAVDVERGTAFQHTVYANNEAVVHVLLDAGAMINVDWGVWQPTPNRHFSKAQINEQIPNAERSKHQRNRRKMGYLSSKGRRGLR